MRGAGFAGGGIFSGQVARDAQVDQDWSGEYTAVGAGKAGGDSVSGVVSGFAEANRDHIGVSEERFAAVLDTGGGTDTGLRGVDSDAAGSGHGSGYRADHDDDIVCGRAELEMAGGGSGHGATGIISADYTRLVPAGADNRVFASGFRSTGRGISTAAVADFGGFGRIHGCWTDGEQTEIVFSAGSAHRFYLRGDLRGIWIYWRSDRDCIVRGVRVARIARIVQRTGWIRADAGAGSHGHGVVSIAD